MKTTSSRIGSIVVALLVVALLLFTAFPALADSGSESGEKVEAEERIIEEGMRANDDTVHDQAQETGEVVLDPAQASAEAEVSDDASSELQSEASNEAELTALPPLEPEPADAAAAAEGDAEAAPVYGPAEVKTDREDYLPGETALISGRGFMPGEEVRLLINDIAGAIVHNELIAADAEGAFIASHVVKKGPVYMVSATGLLSGLVATTSFTDSTAQVTGLGAGTSVSGSTGNPWAGLIIANVDGVGGVLTYCIDILHNIAVGNTLVDGPPTSQEITYILNNYYPLVARGDQLSPLGNETAAIQSAIWHFSDGFVISGPAAIKARAEFIIADALANASGTVVPTLLTLEPREAVNGIGEVHEVTATLSAEPGYDLAGVTVEFKVSGANPAAGSAFTSAGGKAVFSYVGNNTGDDVIEAWVTFSIPAGISFVSPEGTPRRQSLVLAHPTQGRVSDSADKTWVEYGEIYGYKWLDANGDGIHQEGEPSLSGVKIILHGDGIDEETLSDENGYFIFTELPAGQYMVKEEVPEGYYATSPAQVEVALAAGEKKRADFLNARMAWVSGEKLDVTAQVPVAGVKFILAGDGFYKEVFSSEDGSFDFGWLMPGEYHLSEVVPDGWVPVTATEHEMMLENGDEEHFVFENKRLASIYGYKWLDANADGIHQESEPPLSGVSIVLDGEGVHEETLSDENGYFAFEGIGDGQYTIREEVPEGYYATSAAEFEIMLQPGEEKRVDFLNAPLAAVLGTKWLDLNANGRFDEGEEGLGGVTIRLLDADGGIIATMATAADGSYAFTGLEAGEYTVKELVPEGYVATSPTAVFFSLSAGEEKVIDFHNNVQVAGEVITPITPVTPAQPEAGQTLPNTGLEMTWILILIAGMILTGAFIASFGLVRLTR